MTADHAPPTPPRPLPVFFYYAATLLVFLSPSQLAYALDQRHGPFLGYADLLTGVVCFLALLTVVVGHRWRSLTYPPLAAWALLLVGVLSLSRAGELLPGVIDVTQLALYLIAALTLFQSVFTTAPRLQAALLALLAGATLAVVWAGVQYLTLLRGDPRLFDAMQVCAGFTNRNTYSAFLALVLPLALAGALHAHRPLWRVGGALLTAGGLLTLLSGPLLWVTLLSLVWVASTGRGLARWTALAGVAVFLALLLTVFPHNRDAALTELGNPYETNLIHVAQGAPTSEGAPVLKKRWLEWQPALHLLSQNFVLGVGAGNYQANIGQHYSSEFSEKALPNFKKSEPDTNNLYLVFAGSMGFLGLIALVALFGHFWRRSSVLWSYADSPLGRTLAAGLPAAVLSLLLGNLFTAMLVRGLSLVVVLVFALTAAASVVGRRRDEE